jgi:hypothetical protein
MSLLRPVQSLHPSIYMRTMDPSEFWRHHAWLGDPFPRMLLQQLGLHFLLDCHQR